MKYCVVYKTPKKNGVYLFVKNKDDFSQVPEALMQQLGSPVLVMVLPLSNREALFRVDLKTLTNSLTTQGYYLQLPEAQENMLHQHRASLGLSPTPPKKDM